jgi:Fe-S cluster assembly ATPase SufC
MNKIELLKSVNFGESVAELEADNLCKYFLETHHWHKIRHGEVDVVYGPKGSGKSAIYSLITITSRNFFKKISF